MILSKRETIALLLACLTVGVLLLDWYVATPLLERRDTLEAERQALLAQQAEAQATFQRRRLFGPKWQAMLDSGMSKPLAAAESQVLHALRDWSQESRLTLSSLKPGKVVERGDLLEMQFQASGTGSMSAVSKFLWRIETAALPMRIEQLQLGARQEGSDDLSLQLSLSSICLPEPGKTPAPRAGKDAS